MNRSGKHRVTISAFGRNIAELERDARDGLVEYLGGARDQAEAAAAELVAAAVIIAEPADDEQLFDGRKRTTSSAQIVFEV